MTIKKKKIQQITTRKEKHPAVKREMKQHDPLSQNKVSGLVVLANFNVDLL